MKLKINLIKKQRLQNCYERTYLVTVKDGDKEIKEEIKLKKGFFSEKGDWKGQIGYNLNQVTLHGYVFDIDFIVNCRKNKWFNSYQAINESGHITD